MTFAKYPVTFKDACFSNLITDYIAGDQVLRSYYHFSPDKKGIAEALKSRSDYHVDRETLVKVLLKQYESTVFNNSWKLSPVLKNIEALASRETFTITTGHQLNIFTGPLYFIFKILTAIKQAEELKKMFPQQHFVPVYWMATEDHDLEEIKTVNVNGEKLIWQTNQQGATGRMTTEGLEAVIKQAMEKLSGSVHVMNISSVLETAYLKNLSLANATRSLVHELFKNYGLVVVDADEQSLKREAVSVFKDDLLNHTAFKEFKSLNEFEKKYGLQVHARETNLFYLQPQRRDRIIANADGSYEVMDAGITFSKTELLKELEVKPEKFSPNVVLRPLYQEAILPNLCYIGGPAEVHYWLQLKSLFEKNNIFFPVVALRNCLMVVNKNLYQQKAAMDLNWNELFSDANNIANNYFSKKYTTQLNLDDERLQLENVYQEIKEKAAAIDITLKKHVDGELTRLKKRITATEKRMLRALKNRHESEVHEIQNLKNSLFPGGQLQERVENVFPFLANFGADFLGNLKDAMQIFPLEFQVLVDEKDI